MTGYFWLGGYPEAWYLIDASTDPVATTDGAGLSSPLRRRPQTDEAPAGSERAYYQVIGVNLVEEAIRRLAAEPGFYVSRLPGFANRITSASTHPMARHPTRCCAPSTHEPDRCASPAAGQTATYPAWAIAPG